MSEPAPVARTEHFPAGEGPVELDVQVGTGSVRIELVRELGVVEVSVAVGQGAWWHQGLSGVLSLLGAGGPDRPEPQPRAADAEALASTEVDFSPQRSRLTVRAPRTVGTRAVALDVHVRAPSLARVLVRTSSARVDVTGVAQRMDIGTGSGEVDVQDVLDGADVRTGSGQVRLAVLPRGGRVRTGSGDVTVASTADDLEVISGTGDLRIGIASGVTAQVDLSSGSGAVRSDLEVLAVEPPETQAHLRARSGSGTVLVHSAR
ncbi:DUF4097 family beta strand repeat-containing protein [Rhodococcus sp. X156]|uniref:DUF4097 family beta strand repeat-containing protein n=1 Tax=Rhodococcus sp. X156 TaxID=2499145 RepID=UPI000FD9F80C|nr:DUF4097 family beta strand repeat-containing protein [Rhodococcus sp. X156]